ncbi:unnamed protein product, partial [Prunus brigantina]
RGFKCGTHDEPGESEKTESESDRDSINFGALDEAWHQLGDRPVVGIGAEEEPSVVEVTSTDEESEEEQIVGGEQGAEMPRPEVELGVEEEAEDPDLARIDLDGVPVRVSVARSVGEASCSYRRGLPMHPTMCRKMWCLLCRRRMIDRADRHGEVDGLSRRRPASNEPQFAEDDPVYGKILENNPSSQKSWKDHWFFATGCWEVAAGVEKPRALVARRFREKGGVCIGSGELTEDEEGQLEVIRALEASARDATELLSHSSLSASGLLDPVTEGKSLDRGKRPVGEEREAPGAKRPRVEEVEEVVAVGPTPTIHPERLADFVDTTRMVLSGEMSWEGLTLGESTYASSTAMAFEQSALFSHYGAVRRVMIHREKDVARVEAVRALGAAQVEKAELAKEMGRLREKASQLKEENARLQKALENACKPQAEEVKSFLESEEGAELAGEVRLSGGLDLLEKIQKRYPDFVFSLEDLLGEDEDMGRDDPEPTPSAEDQGAEAEVTITGAEQVNVSKEPGAEAEVEDTGMQHN